MSTITLWAIRHNPSGGFLYMPTTYTGRGGSFVEPITFPDKQGRQPRLFMSDRAAKSALGLWLKGKFINHRDSEDEEVMEIRHQPNRKREEMQIVPIDITLPTYQEF